MQFLRNLVPASSFNRREIKCIATISNALKLESLGDVVDEHIGVIHATEQNRFPGLQWLWPRPDDKKRSKVGGANAIEPVQERSLSALNRSLSLSKIQANLLEDCVERLLYRIGSDGAENYDWWKPESDEFARGAYPDDDTSSDQSRKPTARRSSCGSFDSEWGSTDVKQQSLHKEQLKQGTVSPSPINRDYRESSALRNACSVPGWPVLPARSRNSQRSLWHLWWAHKEITVTKLRLVLPLLFRIAPFIKTCDLRCCSLDDEGLSLLASVLEHSLSVDVLLLDHNADLSCVGLCALSLRFLFSPGRSLFSLSHNPQLSNSVISFTCAALKSAHLLYSGEGFHLVTTSLPLVKKYSLQASSENETALKASPSFCFCNCGLTSRLALVQLLSVLSSLSSANVQDVGLDVSLNPFAAISVADGSATDGTLIAKPALKMRRLNLSFCPGLLAIDLAATEGSPRFSPSLLRTLACDIDTSELTVLGLAGLHLTNETLPVTLLSLKLEPGNLQLLDLSFNEFSDPTLILDLLVTVGVAESLQCLVLTGNNWKNTSVQSTITCLTLLQTRFSSLSYVAGLPSLDRVPSPGDYLILENSETESEIKFKQPAAPEDSEFHTHSYSEAAVHNAETLIHSTMTEKPSGIENKNALAWLHNYSRIYANYECGKFSTSRADWATYDSKGLYFRDFNKGRSSYKLVLIQEAPLLTGRSAAKENQYCDNEIDRIIDPLDWLQNNKGGVNGEQLVIPELKLRMRETSEDSDDAVERVTVYTHR